MAKWPPKLSAKDERRRAASGLTAKPDGWYKSIGGKTRYVCKRLPLDEALAILPACIAAAKSGSPRLIRPAEITLKSLVELFTARMWLRVTKSNPKKMARRTYDDYVNVLSRFCEVIGNGKPVSNIGPEDFTAYSDTFDGKAISTRRREIQYIDRLFNFAGPGKRTLNLIPFIVRGPDWNKPSDEELSAASADADKAYTVDQLCAAFAAVADDALLCAAGHLGFGSGFIPIDLSRLPADRPDLDNAIIIYGRGKTGISRMCPLMPAAVDALRNYLAYRARFKNMRESSTDRFFVTIYGNTLSQHRGRDRLAGFEQNWITRRWRAKTGLPFTGLRTTFAALVDDWPDQRAIDIVLGHKAGKMGKNIRTKHYAHRFSPDRARRLVEHAYALAFGQQLQNLPPVLPPALPSPRRTHERADAVAANLPSPLGQPSNAESSPPAAAHPPSEARQPETAP